MMAASGSDDDFVIPVKKPVAPCSTEKVKTLKPKKKKKKVDIYSFETSSEFDENNGLVKFRPVNLKKTVSSSLLPDYPLSKVKQKKLTKEQLREAEQEEKDNDPPYEPEEEEVNSSDSEVATVRERKRKRKVKPKLQHNFIGRKFTFLIFTMAFA